MSKPNILTTNAGIAVADNQNSLTAGPHGPVLMQDFHLIEKLQAFNRERLPERIVDANGSGAYGTFMKADPAYGRTVAEKLGLAMKELVAASGNLYCVK